MFESFSQELHLIAIIFMLSSLLHKIRYEIAGIYRFPVIAAMLLSFSNILLAGAYEDYIAAYNTMAVEQMNIYGIPASITLAQGLLESAAGRSTLAREGNNHFGIKCHRDWQGETMLRNDDAPDECFRVYKTPADSFEDHSRFLCRNRYQPLFSLPPEDYAAWARGLKECGYATDPNYAARLISIIETYSLYLYDTPSNPETEHTVSFIHETLSRSHPVRRSRGLHYVIAKPGDTYGMLAKELKIKKDKLLKYNDMAHDGEIKEWEEVYLQEKLDSAPEGVSSATIGDGESLHSLAQRYGMKLSVIKRLNPDVSDSPGERITLSAQH